MRIETELDGKTVGAIERHYFNAMEKHPYFCDELTPSNYGVEDTDGHLRVLRNALKNAVESGHLAMPDVLNCEIEEMMNAIIHGDTAAAVEECYDAIAVLLRVTDVLEGCQPLGKPGAKEGAEE